MIIFNDDDKLKEDCDDLQAVIEKGNYERAHPSHKINHKHSHYKDFIDWMFNALIMDALRKK